jgi:hypothetical protein
VSGSQIPRVIADVLCALGGDEALAEDLFDKLIPSEMVCSRAKDKVSMLRADLLKIRFNGEDDSDADYKITFATMILDATEDNKKSNINTTLVHALTTANKGMIINCIITIGIIYNVSISSTVSIIDNIIRIIIIIIIGFRIIIIISSRRSSSSSSSSSSGGQQRGGGSSSHENGCSSHVNSSQRMILSRMTITIILK